MLFQHCFIEPFTFPCGIVSVLNVQIRQLCMLPGHAFRIKNCQFFLQYPVRPSIGNNMMQSKKRHMLTLAELQKPYPKKRRHLQVERLLSFLGCQSDSFSPLLFVIITGHGNNRHLEWQIALHNLLRLSIWSGSKPRAYDLMPGNHLAHAVLEGGNIEITFQKYRGWKVIKCTLRLQLVEKP